MITLDDAIAFAGELRRRDPDLDPFAETPANLAYALLVAERMPWAPTDWTLVPAWQQWRAEVGSRRRPLEQPDALLQAARYEADACLSAHSGNLRMAEYYLELAEEIVAEGLAVT